MELNDGNTDALDIVDATPAVEPAKQPDGAAADAGAGANGQPAAEPKIEIVIEGDATAAAGADGKPAEGADADATAAAGADGKPAEEAPEVVLNPELIQTVNSANLAEAAAARLAQKVQHDNDQMKQQFSAIEQEKEKQLAQSIKTQYAAAQNQFAEALENGDTGKILAAQEQMSSLKMQAYDLVNQKKMQQFMAQMAQMAQRMGMPNGQMPQGLPNGQMPQGQPNGQMPQSQPPQAAVEWMNKNPWMRAQGFDAQRQAALEIEATLTAAGNDANNPDFYKKLNVELAKRFPQMYVQTKPDAAAKKADPGASPVAPTANPAATETAGTKTVVKLTAEENAVAESLGITDAKGKMEYKQQLLENEKGNVA